MDRRKLFYYLLLNVFVSACVTGGILFWYDRNYRAVNQPSVQQSASGVVTTVSPQTDIAVKISSVVGAGAKDSEIVVVKFEGEGQLDLTSWQLKDEDGNTFKFPKLTLYPRMDFPENYVPDQVDHPFWYSNHEVFEGMSSPANRDTE